MEKDKKVESEKIRDKTPGSINLLPEASKAEKQTVERKENVNLTSAVGILIVMSVTVGILFMNFNIRSQTKKAESAIIVAQSSINRFKDKEIQIKNTNARFDALTSLKKQDLQYYYFSEEINAIPGVVKVKSFSLDQNKNFIIRGLAISAANYDELVAALEESPDFTNITVQRYENLTQEQKTALAEKNEGAFSVDWTISGQYFREITDNFLVDDLNSVN